MIVYGDECGGRRRSRGRWIIAQGFEEVGVDTGGEVDAVGEGEAVGGHVGDA